MERDMNDEDIKFSQKQENTSVSFSLLELLIALLAASILVNFWTLYINNLLFRKFMLDKNSTYQTFVVAISLTSLFVAFIYMFQIAFNSNYFIT